MALEFKSDQPVQSKIPKQCKFNEEEKRAIYAEVNKLLTKKIIIENKHEKGQFISPIFLRPKKNGTFRLICNLRELNEFIVYRHFKMELLQSALRMMTKNCYMASIDLKDAYYCIPISERHQKYVLSSSGIQNYTCIMPCPMGLCMIPRLFTKVLKPIFSSLRRNGHQSVIYIYKEKLLMPVIKMLWLRLKCYQSLDLL